MKHFSFFGKNYEEFTTGFLMNKNERLNIAT